MLALYSSSALTRVACLPVHSVPRKRPPEHPLCTLIGTNSYPQNHSCNPNSRLYPCYINEGNIQKPLLAIFSRRVIEADEEVCFNYQGSYPGDDDDDNEDEEPMTEREAKDRDLIYEKCMCGAKNCTGTCPWYSVQTLRTTLTDWM